jgi:uncharacterized protein YqeY
MSLKAQIQSSVVESMKARDSQKTQVLRNITSAIKKKEVDERKDLTDAEVLKLIMNLEKQVRETLEQARGLGRAESIEECEYEISVLKTFLPQALSEAELLAETKAIFEELKAAGQLPAGPAAMGALMKATMARIGARADGKAVQAAVKSVLA